MSIKFIYYSCDASDCETVGKSGQTPVKDKSWWQHGEILHACCLKCRYKLHGGTGGLGWRERNDIRTIMK